MLFRCLLVAAVTVLTLSLLENTRVFQLCVKPSLAVVLRPAGVKLAAHRTLRLSAWRAFYRVPTYTLPQGQVLFKTRRPMARVGRFFSALVGQRPIFTRACTHFWWRVALLRTLSPGQLGRCSGHLALDASTVGFNVCGKALWLRPFFFLLGHTRRRSSFFVSPLSSLVYVLFDGSRKVLRFLFVTAFARWEKPVPMPLQALSLTNRLTFFEFAYLSLGAWRVLPRCVAGWLLEQQALIFIGFWLQRGLKFWLRRGLLACLRWLRQLFPLYVKAQLVCPLGVIIWLGEYDQAAYLRCLSIRRAYSYGRVAAATLSSLPSSCVRVLYFFWGGLWRFFVFAFLRLTMRGQALLRLWLYLPWLLQLCTFFRYSGLVTLALWMWRRSGSLASLVCLLPLLATFFLPLLLVTGVYAFLVLHKQLWGLSLLVALRAYRLFFFFPKRVTTTVRKFIFSLLWCFFWHTRAHVAVFSPMPYCSFSAIRSFYETDAPCCSWGKGLGAYLPSCNKDAVLRPFFHGC